MPPVNQALVNEFRAKAEATNAVVREAVDLDAALNYVVEVCAVKTPCEMLADGRTVCCAAPSWGW